MKRKISTVGCLLILWSVAVVAETFAHGDHPKPPAQEATVEDTPAEGAGGFYAVEGEGADATGDASPFSRTRMFSGEGEQSGMEMPSAPVKSETMEHAGHKVKLAEHEWVKTSQKGYGVAAGITALAGLLFGILSLKRKRE